MRQLALVFAALLILACQHDPGRKQAERGPGDGAGGIEIDNGEIAVSPFGDYVVFHPGRKSGHGLAVGWPSRGLVRSLPLQDGEHVERLVFSKRRWVAYLLTRVLGRYFVHAVDVLTRTTSFRREVTFEGRRFDEPKPILAVTDADDRIAVTGGRTLVILSTGGGRPFVRSLLGRATDLRFTPDGRALLLLASDRRADGDSTPLVTIDPDRGDQRTIDVPHCADEINLAGARAFLSSRLCKREVVSVVALDPGRERFERALPAFGPIAVAPGGALLAAHVDPRDVDRSLYDDPSIADRRGLHLVLIDPRTLVAEFVAIGGSTPRLAFTPEADAILLDEPRGRVGARIFDLRARTLRAVEGPTLSLSTFATAGGRAFVLDGDLHEIDIANAQARRIETPFRPRALNVSNDDRDLYLRESGLRLCVWSIAERRCRQWLDGALADR